MIRNVPRRKATSPQSRRGIVLIVVMVVVVMISLAGFGCVASMSNENKAVHVRGEQMQMRSALASAEEYLKLLIAAPVRADDSSSQETSSRQSIDNDEVAFRGVVVSDEDGPGRRIRFTVMSPRYDETGGAAWRYGLDRESSRLDLRTVMDWELLQPGAGRRALMALPGMTEPIADAILDWMDRDNIPRPTGAESEYYATLNPPYAPRNGVPESIEELLLVKGVTRTILFGFDVNQNHRLEVEEQATANSSSSTRDASGERLYPWAELLTVYGGEKNRSRDGKPRINLNQFNLGELHRQLTADFDPKLANYVILYRQFGPFQGPGQIVDASTIVPNFTVPPRVSFRSPLDLVQSRVQIAEPGLPPKMINCPLPSEPEQLGRIFGMLYDRLTVAGTPTIRGRVNLNTAPPEVLRAVPGIDKALAEQIATSRNSNSNGDQRFDEHPCWLLTESLVDLKKMKEIYPYLTVGGDVYRAQVVAFSEESRLSQRVELVLDASRAPARRVFFKDLQILGRGYRWDVLDTPGGISTPSGAFDAASYRD